MKLLATLILSTLILSAQDNTNYLKAQILEKVFSKISIDKELLVWSDNSELLLAFKENGSINTSQECENASLLIVQNSTLKLKKACQQKSIFVLNYNLLKELPQSFGALFWKKGRPNIVIIEPRIKLQSIKVSEELTEYLEETIW